MILTVQTLRCQIKFNSQLPVLMPVTRHLPAAAAAIACAAVPSSKTSTSAAPDTTSETNPLGSASCSETNPLGSAFCSETNPLGSAFCSETNPLAEPCSETNLLAGMRPGHSHGSGIVSYGSGTTPPLAEALLELAVAAFHLEAVSGDGDVLQDVLEAMEVLLPQQQQQPGLPGRDAGGEGEEGGGGFIAAQLGRLLRLVTPETCAATMLLLQRFCGGGGRGGGSGARSQDIVSALETYASSPDVSVQEVGVLSPA